MCQYIGNTKTTESEEKKLSGVALNKNPDFKNYVNVLCKKVGQRLPALEHKSNCMEEEK